MNEITLNGQSEDIVSGNIQKLKRIFTEVFCEESIDFKKLQAVLGEDDGNQKNVFYLRIKGEYIAEAQRSTEHAKFRCG